MITVYDDAPEQNKELKERGTTDAQRLCLRAVGEPLGVRVAQKGKRANLWSCVQKGAYGGIFAYGEYIRPLRLESKLSDLRVGYANSHLATQDKFES